MEVKNKKKDKVKSRKKTLRRRFLLLNTEENEENPKNILCTFTPAVLM